METTYVCVYTDTIMSFLSIPHQEGLFIAIKEGKSADGAERCPTVDTDEDDEDDEDDTDDVRLIPRCSPVPRKRGSSIVDETAEYMRIQLALSGGKRVSFADTTGGDLVDVKEFIAFDSDDEDSAKWEEEEAKYKEAKGEPKYYVQAEFSVPSESALLQAVRTNKVEVERVSPVEDEPLSFWGMIRVLNISFNKAVYIRFTMDHWASYYDQPAEYVEGSHDGDTDRFSFKLSFAPPYTTHGSCIEFVVRYETSEGDYWANNSSMNYVVTLLLFFEDSSAQRQFSIADVRGILRPPKVYSAETDLDSEDEPNTEEHRGSTESGLVRPTAICPVIVQPEIDVETAVHPSVPTVPPNGELPSVDGALSTHCEITQSPCTSSSSPLQTLPIDLNASEAVQPNNHCKLGYQSPEQHQISNPSALLPASCPSMSQSPMLRPDWSQATEEEPTGTNVLVGSAQSPDADPSLALPTHCVSAAHSSELCVLVTGLSEGPNSSVACYHHSMPLLSPVAQSQNSPGARGETRASLQENDSESLDVTEVCQSCDIQSALACTERKHACKTSPDVLLENLPSLLCEHDLNRILMPSLIFLSTVVSLAVVLKEPSAMFVIGLFLILHCL